MKEEKKQRPRGQIKDMGGGKFRIAVPLGEGPKGERPYHHETLHNSTPAKDLKRVNSILAKVDDDTYFEPSRMLLKEATTMWLERVARKEKQGKLKRSTLQTCEFFVDTYIAEKLGESQLRHLSVKNLQDFFDDLEDDGMKPSTMRLIYTPIKQTLDLMVRFNHLRENPVLKVELPQMNDPKKAKPFDEKEVFRFITAALEVPNDFIFLFALITGVRPCEFLGLKYPYLELVMDEEGVERGLCRVTETIVKDREGGWYFSTPKTKKGRRPICFPAFMYHSLMARKDAHLENLARLGKSHQLVFTNSKGEPLGYTTLNNSRFVRVLKRAEIPTEGRTLYSLRRSSATLSMLLGESPRALSDKLGRASVEFTQDEYVDVLPVTQRIMSDRLENFLFRTNFAQHGAERVM